MSTPTTYEKITNKESLTTLADGDLFVVVDVSDQTGSNEGTTKKIQKQYVLGDLNGVTASTADLNSTTNFEETISATTSEVTIATGKTLNVSDDGGFKINETAVTATATELNLLDGLAAVTGSDTSIVTGTAGTSGDLSQWDANGDLIDGPTPPTGTIVGTTDTQTLTNKTLSSATNVFPSASTTASGDVELATVAETDTGTDATRAVTPDGLAGSNYGEKGFCLPVFESDISVSTGNGTVAFTVPSTLNGWNLVDATASVHTKGVTGTTDVMIRRRRAGSDADMLSAAITIGDEWFASDGTINTSNDDVNTGDQIYIDVDAVHSGTAPLGLSISCVFRLP